MTELDIALVANQELQDRIEQLEAQLALSRSASRANWFRFIKTQRALYGAMTWLDVSQDPETLKQLQQHQDWWADASDVLGWNFDFSSVEARYDRI